MSTLTKSLLGDYSNAISQFQFACLGSYPGPSMPMNLLGELVGAVDGIAPENLVKNTVAAVGGNRPKGGGAGLAGYLQQDDSEVAQGAMREHLCGVQEDLDIDRQNAAHLTSSAEQCSGAIADVVDVSDTALTELISAVIPLLNILSMVATKHPLARFIIPILSTIGGRVIEETNHNIASTCRDRDDAIESCYNEFESRCECVCERPIPEECPAPAKPADGACPAPVEQCPDTPTPTKPMPKEECPPPPSQPTEPAQVECPPQPTPPSPPPAPPRECPEPERTSTPSPEPSAKTEVHTEITAEHGLGCHCQECIEQSFTERSSQFQREVEITRPAQAEIIPPQEPPEQPQQVEEPCPEPEPQPEPKPKPDLDTEPASESGAGEETLCPESTAESTEECVETTQTSSEGCGIESSCSGSLGIVGAGIALVGVGLIVEGAAQCLEIMSEADCPVQEPEPGPVPEAELEPEPDPCPEPKPEPEPEPKPEPIGDDGVMTPPPELSQVEEPTPPPEKVAHLPASGPAEAPAPPPAPAPEPAPAPAPQPAPQQEAAPAPEEPTIKARKAGQW